MYAFWNLLFTFEFVFTVEFLCDINKKTRNFIIQWLVCKISESGYFVQIQKIAGF